MDRTFPIRLSFEKGKTTPAEQLAVQPAAIPASSVDDSSFASTAQVREESNDEFVGLVGFSWFRLDFRSTRKNYVIPSIPKDKKITFRFLKFSFPSRSRFKIL